jgi:hypothetical protein
MKKFMDVLKKRALLYISKTMMRNKKATILKRINSNSNLSADFDFFTKTIKYWQLIPFNKFLNQLKVIKIKIIQYICL